MNLNNVINQITEKAVELTKGDFPGKENFRIEEFGIGGKGLFKAIDKETGEVKGTGHSPEEALYYTNSKYFFDLAMANNKHLIESNS